MATFVASFPLPLPLHSLFVSSWTWLALSLATIVTLLRALSRTSLSRHRPQALLPPPPSLFSAETPSISEVLSVSHPLQKAQKRGVSSKNTSRLQSFCQNPDGLACPGLGFFSCLGDGNTAPSRLHRVALASKNLNAYGGRDYAEGAFRSCPDTICCKLGLGLRLGLLVDTERGEMGTPAHDLIQEGVNSHHMWTSDVLSACKPLQTSLFELPPPSLEVPPCFEVQFGWHSLLDSRLGSPWRHHVSRLTPASMHASKPMDYNGHVVKLWSIHQRNLYKVLKVQEASVTALDVNTAGAHACIAHRNGEISRWDIANEACLSRVGANVTSIFTLCLNAEKGVAIAGNDKFFGLWDFKSPSLIPVVDWSRGPRPLYPPSCIALRCKGDTLCVDQGNGNFFLCDLRKSQGNCLSTGPFPNSLLVSSKMVEEEESLVLWEKLAFENEESWEDPLMGCGDVFQKSNSFTLMCTTLVQSLSSSGR